MWNYCEGEFDVDYGDAEEEDGEGECCGEGCEYGEG